MTTKSVESTEQSDNAAEDNPVITIQKQESAAAAAATASNQMPGDEGFDAAELPTIGVDSTQQTFLHAQQEQQQDDPPAHSEADSNMGVLVADGHCEIRVQEKVAFGEMSIPESGLLCGLENAAAAAETKGLLALSGGDIPEPTGGGGGGGSGCRATLAAKKSPVAVASLFGDDEADVEGDGGLFAGKGSVVAQSAPEGDVGGTRKDKSGSSARRKKPSASALFSDDTDGSGLFD